MKIKSHLGILLFLVTFFSIYTLVLSQNVHIQSKILASDTIVKHSPQRAAMFSAILPGAGQIYNRKYWKVPIIYASFGVSAYFIQYNYKNYTDFSNAYKIRIDQDPTTTDPYEEIYTADNLKFLRDVYRRNFELSCITAAAVYVLNIIDALVDAHLFYFHIDDDLSLRLQPSNIYLTSNNILCLEFSIIF